MAGQSTKALYIRLDAEAARALEKLQKLRQKETGRTVSQTEIVRDAIMNLAEDANV